MLLYVQPTVTPCTTFGPPRNRNFFVLVSDSRTGFYKEKAPLPTFFVPTFVFQIFLTQFYTHMLISNLHNITPPSFGIPKLVIMTATTEIKHPPLEKLYHHHGEDNCVVTPITGVTIILDGHCHHSLQIQNFIMTYHFWKRLFDISLLSYHTLITQFHKAISPRRLWRPYQHHKPTMNKF